jgi:uncharacterized protein (DUF362 family)
VRFRPVLKNPNALIVSRTAVSAAPTPAEFAGAARAVLEATGLELSGERVVIKPNLTTAVQRADPDDGICTHPSFLRGVVDHLRAHGAARDKLYVLEDPLDEDHDGPRDWDRTGVPQALAGTGVKLRFPTARTVTRCRVPEALVHAERRVARLAVDPASVLINVPKLKTHTWAVTTVCMKNLMGLDYAPDRHYCAQSAHAALSEHAGRTDPRNTWLTTADHERIQRELAKRLVDLSKIVRPVLNVVESVVGRDGTGFHQGKNHPLGLCIAGTNAVTVDAFASWLMGFDPLKLIYLQVAAAAGLGEIDPRKIEVYTVEIGGLVRCRDAAGLRIEPPFRVLLETTDEDPDRYR